jgi:tetratricopeptide (TPR) repeat protein
MTAASRPSSTLLCGLSIALLAAGCAGPQRPADGSTPVQEIVMEETLIQGSAKGDGAGRIYELPDLFKEANDYLIADDFKNAIRLYKVILKNFSEPEYRRVTTYNLQRLGLCLWELGDYEGIKPVVARQFERSDLTLMEEIDAELLLGNALLELRDWNGAERAFLQVVHLNERGLRAWDPDKSSAGRRPYEPTSTPIARAHFGRGRIFHETFSTIRLVLPKDAIRKALLDKTRLFEQAQEAYLSSVRTGDPEWATAAGFMVGQLFEDFYLDVLASEVPRDFNELELEVYFDELRAFIAPAIGKARRLYELNLGMAQRLGSRGAWVDETIAAIERVRGYIDRKEGWLQEQTLIVEQRHPHSARFSDQMQFRSDRAGR